MPTFFRVLWGTVGTMCILLVFLRQLLPPLGAITEGDVLLYIGSIIVSSAMIWIAALCKEKEK